MKNLLPDIFDSLVYFNRATLSMPWRTTAAVTLYLLEVPAGMISGRIAGAAGQKPHTPNHWNWKKDL